MEKIQTSTPEEQGEEKSSRPWLRAILSGAVFGTLGAAAAHWLGYHSLSVAERSKPAFGRNWISAAAGIASGTVAVYGTLRADDKPPRSVFPEDDKQRVPNNTVSADAIEHDGPILSPGQRSL